MTIRTSLLILVLILGCLSVVAEPPPNPHEKPGIKGDGNSPLAPPEELSSPEPIVETSGLCNDLARFTCAPGEYDDGTGSVLGLDHVVKRFKAFSDKQKDALKAQFATELKKKSYFRKNALSATGLFHSPDCRKADDPKRREACDAVLSEALATLAMERVLSRSNPAPNEIYHEGKIEDLDFLLNSREYQGIESALIKKAKVELSDKEAEAKLKDDIFPKVVTLITNLIKRVVKDPALQAHLLEKVEAIAYLGNDCASLLKGDQNRRIDGMLIDNAAYDPMSNTFKYCNGSFLKITSLFTIVGTIAHELSHAFDPCEIAVGPSDVALKYSNVKDLEKSQSEFPFERLIACLRSEESVGAKRRPPTLATQGYGTMPNMDDPSSDNARPVNGAVNPAPPPGPNAPPQPGPIPPTGGGYPGYPGGYGGFGGYGGYPVGVSIPIEVPDPRAGRSIFCGDDQIGESFADWVSAEILPEYMSQYHPELTAEKNELGYANVFRGHCDNLTPSVDLSLVKFDVHPPLKARVNKILLANPKVRKQMGCPVEMAGATYCSVPGGHS